MSNFNAFSYTKGQCRLQGQNVKKPKRKENKNGIIQVALLYLNVALGTNKRDKHPKAYILYANYHAFNIPAHPSTLKERPSTRRIIITA